MPVRRFLSTKYHLILNWMIFSKNCFTIKSYNFLLANSYCSVNSSTSSVFKLWRKCGWYEESPILQMCSMDQPWQNLSMTALNPSTVMKLHYQFIYIWNCEVNSDESQTVTHWVAVCKDMHWFVAQVAQRLWSPLLGDVQKPPGHGPEPLLWVSLLEQQWAWWPQITLPTSVIPSWVLKEHRNEDAVSRHISWWKTGRCNASLSWAADDLQ